MSALVQYEQRQDYEGRPLDGWYWRDDFCEEWMGPFPSLWAAMDDYHELRNDGSK